MISVYSSVLYSCPISSKYKSNNKIAYSCKYHVVWCPKYKRKVLIDGVDIRLKEILNQICDEFKSELIELEVIPDHVHILVECDPQFGIAKLIRYMKGCSSRLLRLEFPWLKKRLPTLARFTEVWGVSKSHF
jgi:putative transposase